MVSVVAHDVDEAWFATWIREGSRSANGNDHRTSPRDDVSTDFRYRETKPE
jgi:hypothetical protein